MTDIDRRDFIKRTSAAGLGALAVSRGIAPALLTRRSPNETVRVAVIGVNGRGVVHAQNFAKLANSEVAYICDVDSNVVAKGLDAAKSQAQAPRTTGDFRRILDDKTVDALSMATPDHWHAPMTLLALHAGKHVYLEKPSGHDPYEDELLMQAARKYDRPPLHVHLGTKPRSGPPSSEPPQRARDGRFGRP